MSTFEPSRTSPGTDDFPSEVAGRQQVGATCPYCPAPVQVGVVIRVCPDCKAVHHNACWRKHGRCGAFDCKTSRHYAPPASESVLVITTAELERANPLPSRPSTATGRPLVRPTHSGPTVDRLAIQSLIAAILGIPFFGVLTGLVAIGMATTALFRINKTRAKGQGLAVAALALGVIDVLGWVVFLAWSLAGTDPGQMIRDQMERQRPAKHALMAPVEPGVFVTVPGSSEDRKS